MNVTIGARIIKTGIAVALALFVAQFFNVQSVVLAGVSAVFAIQPSVYRSWQHLLEQVQFNTLGAALALGVSMVMPVNEVVVGVTCIAIISIIIAMGKETAVTLTLVTTLLVLYAGGEWQYALERFLLILTGIGAAFIVNAVIMPPNFEKQFMERYKSAMNTLSLLLRTAVSDELKECESRNQRESLNTSVRKMNEQYGALEEEWKKWNKRKVFRPRADARELVVYKYMVRAMEQGLRVFDAVEQHYFNNRKEGDDDRLFDERLEELIRYHEYTLLKYEGKIKDGEQLYDKVGEDMERFFRDLVSRIDGDEAERAPLVLVASSMFEYGNELRQLDKMIKSE